MSRQLATIQTIESVITHPNADSLQLAKVLGWTVVIRTEEFLPGQKVIYLEIDSLIPVTATWIPLPLQQRIITEKITEHYRVKTMKIRREFSQGLCIAIPADLAHLEVGTDVTDILGITKYCNDAHEIYESNGGNFPTHLISYTDEVIFELLLELLLVVAFAVPEIKARMPDRIINKTSVGLVCLFFIYLLNL